jgi:NADH-quinone oxidoreductase subunit C
VSEVEVVAVDPVVQRLTERFGERLELVNERVDCLTAVVGRDNLIEVASYLRDEPELAFARLSDICGVDYLDQERDPRFAVVYHLHSFLLKRYFRLRVMVDEDDAIVPSLCTVWPGANYFERETFDMYGIRFDGHPDLKRILMPDDWEGYPLRKDDGQAREPIEFSFNPGQWQKAVQRGD